MARPLALVLSLLLLLHAAGARYTGHDLSSTTFTTFASPSERAAFWDAAKSARLHRLDDDVALPELRLNYTRVAVCITGGVRGFPDPAHGIVDSVKRLLVDALDANVTDFYFLLELNDAHDGGKKGGSFSYSAFSLPLPRSVPH